MDTGILKSFLGDLNMQSRLKTIDLENPYLNELQISLKAGGMEMCPSASAFFPSFS